MLLDPNFWKEFVATRTVFELTVFSLTVAFTLITIGALIKSRVQKYFEIVFYISLIVYGFVFVAGNWEYGIFLLVIGVTFITVGIGSLYFKYCLSQRKEK